MRPRGARAPAARTGSAGRARRPGSAIRRTEDGTSSGIAAGSRRLAANARSGATSGQLAQEVDRVRLVARARAPDRVGIDEDERRGCSRGELPPQLDERACRGLPGQLAARRGARPVERAPQRSRDRRRRTADRSTRRRRRATSRSAGMSEHDDRAAGCERLARRRARSPPRARGRRRSAHARRGRGASSRRRVRACTIDPAPAARRHPSRPRPASTSRCGRPSPYEQRDRSRRGARGSCAAPASRRTGCRGRRRAGRRPARRTPHRCRSARPARATSGTPSSPETSRAVACETHTTRSASRIARGISRRP